MSRGMRLSVLGLYKADSGLFSEMVYPSGFNDDEKQTTVGNILAECAELECLFADEAFRLFYIDQFTHGAIRFRFEILDADGIVRHQLDSQSAVAKRHVLCCSSEAA